MITTQQAQKLLSLFRASGKTYNLKKRIDNILETEPDAKIGLVINTKGIFYGMYSEYKDKVTPITLEGCLKRVDEFLNVDDIKPLRYSLKEFDYILIEPEIYEMIILQLIQNIESVGKAILKYQIGE